MIATPADVIREARSLRGVAFRYQGRNPATGIDCLGLLLCVARGVGSPCKDVRGYSRWFRGDKLVEALEAQCEEAEPGTPGSIIVLRCGRSRKFEKHLAIRTEGRRMVDASSNAGRVEESGIPFGDLAYHFKFPGVNYG